MNLIMGGIQVLLKTDYPPNTHTPCPQNKIHLVSGTGRQPKRESVCGVCCSSEVLIDLLWPSSGPTTMSTVWTVFWAIRSMVAIFFIPLLTHTVQALKHRKWTETQLLAITSICVSRVPKLFLGIKWWRVRRCNWFRWLLYSLGLHVVNYMAILVV